MSALPSVRLREAEAARDEQTRRANTAEADAAYLRAALEAARPVLERVAHARAEDVTPELRDAAKGALVRMMALGVEKARAASGPQ